MNTKVASKNVLRTILTLKCVRCDKSQDESSHLVSAKALPIIQKTYIERIQSQELLPTFHRYHLLLLKPTTYQSIPNPQRSRNRALLPTQSLK